MIGKTLMLRSLLFVSALFFTQILIAQPVLDEGKALFKTNCATCHNKNMKDRLTGPALSGTNERWEGREELLYAWIRNSQAVIATGDAYANAIYKEYNNSVMTAFPNLTDPQIDAILQYIQAVSDGIYPPKVDGDIAGTGAVGAPKTDNTFLYVTLLIILGILAIVLARIIGNLNHLAEVRAGNTDAKRKTFADILTSRGVVGFVDFCTGSFRWIYYRKQCHRFGKAAGIPTRAADQIFTCNTFRFTKNRLPILS